MKIDDFYELFNHIREGILVSSNKGKIIYVNKSAQEIIGLSEEKIKEIVDKKNIKYFISKDGSRLLIEDMEIGITSFEINDRNKKLSIFLIKKQIKRKDEELESEFISKISHDIRTQVAAIKGSLDNVIDGIVGEITSKQRKFLSIAADSADRLIKLSEDLLYLSRIESGTMDIQKEKVNLLEVVEKSVDSMRVIAATKDIKISYNIPDKLTYVIFDKVKLERVLINLLDNSIKYTPIGGNIFINAKEEKNFVILSVSDSGVGIPQELLPNLFTKFKFFDSNGKIGGLGLLIIKEIIDAHNEKIWVKSEKGKGTIFTFTLKKA